MMEKKKIVMWCGNAANQKALANKIADKFFLAGIVVDKKATAKKPSFFKRAFAGLQDRIFFQAISQAWSGLQQEYSKRYPSWPDVPILFADSINLDNAYEFTQKLSPDLVVVSGTGMVRSKMLSLKPAIGIINLHTGLSPYIKGGPNCTNWCIATKQYDLIGNTIMWINEGIDSGNIITSERTVISGANNLYDIHWQVMEHAHSLYIAAVSYLLSTTAPYNAVSQKQITTGNLYLTRMWDFSAKRKLLNNLPEFLKTKIAPDPAVVTVSLKQAVNG
jgi:hypothetical protein